ncbi:MAG TPA: STAS domain-containing protein [Terriglobia bacterium]|nr:STAS domain-containing protein [Terriglobia bacterium]
MMEMREARRNDVWVLALKGRLDAVSTPCVRNRLQERIDQGGRRFAVDAAVLTYISNSGLALLLQVGKQIQERSGRMVLCALHKPVKRVLEITGFMSLFSISARRKRPFRLPVRLTLFEPPLKRLTSLQRKQFSEIFRVSLILAASYNSAKQA